MKNKRDGNNKDSQGKTALEEIAKQALKETQARKREVASEVKLQKGEVNGPKGPEPTRYGDWERKGIVYDF